MNQGRPDAAGFAMTTALPCVRSVGRLEWVRRAERLLGAVCFLMASAAVQAGLEEGEAAFKRGDYVVAIAELMPLARAGRPEAEYRIGAVYMFGLGAAKDDKIAFLWLNRAARNGHPSAQYLFGMLHAEGRGTEIDPEVAAVWLTKAAKKGVVPAQHELGRLHAEGFLGKRDLRKATYWLELAAQADHAPAQVALARVLVNLRNERYDLEAAKRWVARAAELGNADGQARVASNYLLQRMYPQAVDLFSKAAGQGHAGAQASLGRMYLQGDGVPMDHKEAFVLLCKAAAQGESSAFYNLGTIFLDGLGQRRDLALSTAMRWLARDADAMPGQAVIQHYPASFTDGDVAAVAELANALERPGAFQKALDAYLRAPPMSVTKSGQKDEASRLVERIRP